MKVLVEINCESEKWEKNEMLPFQNIKKFITNVTKATLNHIEFSCKELTLSVLLTNNKKISKMNEEFLQKKTPTNILSFPYAPEDIFTNKANYIDQEVLLGDIALAYETIYKESQEQNWPFQASEKCFENHLTHLIIHGVLHLFGYDHITDEDADIMENIEIEILKKFDIENPYLEK